MSVFEVMVYSMKKFNVPMIYRLGPKRGSRQKKIHDTQYDIRIFFETRINTQHFLSHL